MLYVFFAILKKPRKYTVFFVSLPILFDKTILYVRQDKETLPPQAHRGAGTR